MMRAIYNTAIFDGNSFHENSCVLIKNDVIVDVIQEAEMPADAEQYDAGGGFLVPAFIDLQIYGGNGKLFSEEMSFASIDATDAYCISGGCTRFLITVATNSFQKMIQAIETVKAYQQQESNGLLGLHLEGPYINPLKRGAHIEQYIRQATIKEIKQLLEIAEGVIKMITLAPELCSDEVIELLSQNKIIVSAGHSNATYQQAISAFNSGITAATHLFNAMSAMHGRKPGMVGAIYDHTLVNSSIVCDGIHTDFASVRISKKIMKDRLFLITDAVTETKGAYTHLFKNDRYVLLDGTLSGSALTMMKAISNCMSEVGISFEEALRMASLYPARVIGIDDMHGRIQKGYKADFVILSPQKQVLQKIRNGVFL